MPVTAGRGHADHPAPVIIREMEIGLVSIVPTGHSPLCIVFVPQMVVLKGVTLAQVTLWIIPAGQ
ncbi:hypothetical protein, partial [Xenorhabdus doucetiae]|uniref:hypothetical protein n=1 Tax=Xenorhabdus doucetiae TaxID=351671 RepID=UPI0038CD9848